MRRNPCIGVACALMLVIVAGCKGGGSTTTGDVLETAADAVSTSDTVIQDNPKPDDTTATDAHEAHVDTVATVDVAETTDSSDLFADLVQDVMETSWKDSGDTGAAADADADVDSYRPNCEVTEETMMMVPAGTFTMGSPVGEPGRFTNETQHVVTISRAFLMKATEVTQGEWQTLMGNNPSVSIECGASCPVDDVSWWDAIAYCNAMSVAEELTPCYDLTGCTGTPGIYVHPEHPCTGAMTVGYSCTNVTFAGLTCTGYRLPTESEWEYAARAGTTTSTYNGDIDEDHLVWEVPNVILDPIAWYNGNADGTTHAVNGKLANAWCLHDMLGNVGEWVLDEYGNYPTGPVTDPLNMTSIDPPNSYRLVRGGSWNGNAQFNRAASRNFQDPSYRNCFFGFRIARTL